MPRGVDKGHFIRKVWFGTGKDEMESPKRKRRAGRPSRELVPGERVPMSFRVRPELKDMMDKASEASGRSVAQEIELRLEQSFDAESRFRGPQAYTITIVMLSAFLRGGDTAAHLAGHPEWELAQWINDRHCYEQAIQGVVTALWATHPAADIQSADRKAWIGTLIQRLMPDETPRNLERPQCPFDQHTLLKQRQVWKPDGKQIQQCPLTANSGTPGTREVRRRTRGQAVTKDIR
jgi:hypothetical protein